jgi:hypothetical protein
MGIDGSLLNWLKCYPHDRKQQILCAGQVSRNLNVPSDVVQGSVFGLLLFNIFVSDLPNCVSSNQIVYADVSTLYIYIKTLSMMK